VEGELHTFLTCALDGDDWLVAGFGYLATGEKSAVTR